MGERREPEVGASRVSANPRNLGTFGQKFSPIVGKALEPHQAESLINPEEKPRD